MSTPIAKIDDKVLELIIIGDIAYLNSEYESRYKFISIYPTIDFTPIIVRAYSMELMMGEVSDELRKRYINKFKDLVDKCKEAQKCIISRNQAHS